MGAGNATSNRESASTNERPARISAEKPSPAPEIASADPWQRAAQVSVVGLFVLAAMTSLYFTHSVVVPVLLAFVVATILLPVVEHLETWRVPRALGVVLVSLILLSIIFLLATILTIPLTYWMGRASEIGALIREKMRSINEPLTMLREMGSALGQAAGMEGGGLKIDQSSTSIVGGILSFVTPAVSQTVLFLFAMIFYLIYQKRIKKGLVFLVEERETRLTTLRIITDVQENLTTYFGAFTLVNICIGTVTTLLAYVAGLPNALLWGVLAAVLNYIPYLGPATMIATLFFVGVFTLPTVVQALFAPVAFIAITTIEGQLIAPTFIGHKLTLNPFSIFLSIAFWTWMWGPIGAFLATPILIIGMVIVRHVYSQDLPELPE